MKYGKIGEERAREKTERKPRFKMRVDILGDFIGRIIQSLLYFIRLPYLLAFPGCVHNVYCVLFFSKNYWPVLLWSRQKKK